tara:strand:+ start:10202 stop:10558 length:357 start_codon:yes stop_codon:yes gene_type:complete
MTRASYIAIIEFLIIAGLVWWFVFKPSESVDLSKYESMEKEYAAQKLIWEKEQEKNLEKIDSIQTANASLMADINKGDNDKTKNSQDLNDRVSTIRSASLDSVTTILTGQSRRKPTGY